jgi:hypothetical protein
MTTDKRIKIESDLLGKWTWRCRICNWHEIYCDSAADAERDATGHLEREHGGKDTP